MRLVKRLLSILLVLVLAISLFSGCGNKKGKKGSGGSLEDTWRLKKEIYEEHLYVYDENGNLVLLDDYTVYKETEYPDEETDGSITMYSQPYYQFKNNIKNCYDYYKLNLPVA